MVFLSGYKKYLIAFARSNFTNPAVDFREAAEYCTYFNAMSVGPCEPLPIFQTTQFGVKFSGQLLTVSFYVLLAIKGN